MSLGKRLWEGVGKVLELGQAAPRSVPKATGFPPVRVFSPVAPTKSLSEMRAPVELQQTAYKLEVVSGNYTPPFVVVGAPTSEGQDLEMMLVSESGSAVSGTPVRTPKGVVVEDSERVGHDGKPVVWRLTPLKPA